MTDLKDKVEAKYTVVEAMAEDEFQRLFDKTIKDYRQLLARLADA